jgi:hypothetical protein
MSISAGQPTVPVEQHITTTTAASGLLTVTVPSTSRYTTWIDLRNFRQLLQQQPQYVQDAPPPNTPAIPTITQYDSNVTELQRIKLATQAIPHRGAAAAVANASHVHDTGGILGRDNPKDPISGAAILQDDIPGQGGYLDYPWIERRKKWTPPYYPTSDVSGPTPVKW